MDSCDEIVAVMLPEGPYSLLALWLLRCIAAPFCRELTNRSLHTACTESHIATCVETLFVDLSTVLRSCLPSSPTKAVRLHTRRPRDTVDTHHTPGRVLFFCTLTAGA